jgi:Tfp pilus assembly protein PilF
MHPVVSGRRLALRLRILPLLLLAAFLVGGEDPFEAPPELLTFARRQTINSFDSRIKLDSIAKSFFAPVEEGGLGMVYDNSYTRTVREGYQDRRANCFTLTAMYIACCRAVGVEAHYAESLRISHWRRVGNTIRYERHFVALMGYGTLSTSRVADFLPEVSQGAHNLVMVTQERALAIFHSNRAIELLNAGQTEAALAAARTSVKVDPTHGGGWNILGVVQRDQGMDQAAEASFRQAMALDSKDGIPCGNLELLLRAQGRDQEAADCREQAMNIRKKDPYFNAFLAGEALEACHWEEAEKRVKAALSILPHEPEFFLLQARINLAQGQQKAAVKSLEQAQKWAIPEDQPRWNAKLALLKSLRP